MTHDHLCLMLRTVMTEDHDPKVCAWCQKITIIRDEEATLMSMALEGAIKTAEAEGYEKGYLQGVADMKMGEKLAD